MTVARAPFVDERMSVLLDALRGLSALVVLLGHAVQLRIYTGPWPFSASFQHGAVVVFFVLSGIVIASSVQRPGASLSGYAWARARRIMPVALCAIILGAAAWSIVTLRDGPLAGPPHNLELSGAALLWPAMFLSERMGIGPAGNPPYWSLCYEVAYYALFGAAWFLRGWRRVVAVAVIAALAGGKVLLLAPVWLMGVVVVLGWDRVRVPRYVGWVMLGAGVALFIPLATASAGARIEQMAGAMTGIDMAALGYARTVVSDVALGICVASALFGMRAVGECWPPLPRPMAKGARLLAAISFSLYLSHWPVMCSMRAFGISAADNIALALMLLLVPLGFAGVMSWFLERRAWARIR